jgi:hypothetical protein
MRRLVLIAITVYIVWLLATYLLEGRINLLQKPNPFGRFTYAIIANILIGTIIAILSLRPSIKSRFSTLDQLGFQPIRRTLIIAAIAAIIGFFLFVAQRPASLNAIVIMNVFAQTLPTSIAEVLICWALLGVTFESLIGKRRRIKNDIDNNKKGRVTSIIAGGAVATILFGIYHFAHSPPFNQPIMVLLLMYPGILTSIIYFIGRDIYAAIIFHNFQALFGVMAGISIEPFTRLLYPVIILGIASMFVLVISDMLLIRRRMNIGNSVDTTITDT